MKLVEGWGSGFSLIINGAKECEIKKPEFIESPNAFRINLFRSDVFDTEAKHNDSSDIDNKSTSENIGIATEKNEPASENIGITSEKKEEASGIVVDIEGFNIDIDRINSELTKRFKALFTAGLKGNQTTIKGRRGPRLRGE